MDKSPIEEAIQRNVGILSRAFEPERRMTPKSDGAFPSVQGLKDIISLVKAIVLPDYFDCRRNNEAIRSYYLGVNLEKLSALLTTEIQRALLFNKAVHPSDMAAEALDLTIRFIDQLPEIKRLLYTDIQAIYNNDPAVDNYAEVILSYPVVVAMTHYRTAHAFHTLGIPVIPRVVTEFAHSATGIDIHPGAQIGEYFAIDHGTGVVIGETCVIGNHVTLYQGVTLGAKNFSLDSNGHPVNVPRHPILEDNVTVYSNSSILGRITVGKNSIIGGNIWLTHSVPEGSRILQRKAVNLCFSGGLGI